ncbi:unnamed protein product [Paramecium sonneborni]|uniref:Uncharacterized protein n=1 Tax=Paramecium sonneborni TaxID=65129 RepID=A0A8S1MRW3_9CILI|nr:unnamed protein product [Paramecium sonneborni]
MQTMTQLLVSHSFHPEIQEIISISFLNQQQLLTLKKGN